MSRSNSTKAAASESSRAQEVLAQRALGFLGGAVVCLLFMALDGFVFGWRWELIAVRVVWAVFMALAAWATFRGTAGTGRAFLLGSAVVSTAGFVAIVALTGGIVGSPYVLWLSGFACALAPFSRAATGLSAAIVVMAVAALVHFGAVPPGVGALTIVSAVMSGALGIYTAVMFRELRTREGRAHELRLAAEKELAHSERRRAISERLATAGQLASGVAHEINNPLGFVRANLQFLASSGPELDAEERAEAFQETLSGVERIARIVRDLKVFARADGGDLEQSDLHSVLGESLRLCAPSARLKGVQVALEAAGESRQVVWPVGRIVQVLVNLILNAVDACAGTGSSEATHVSVRVALQDTGSGIRIAVIDHGPGVAPALRSRLFEPFFTTKAIGQGTGLGLALAREYAIQAGGALSFQETPGGGATFTLDLPDQVVTAASANESSPAIDADRPTARYAA